ncbi:MAG: hypothetical protein D3917_14655 [Candidatus Electrothrix sp. AX5]|nr:hypothetical protein [Candidatus Electrothrix sp. AX5]
MFYFIIHMNINTQTSFLYTFKSKPCAISEVICRSTRKNWRCEAFPFWDECKEEPKKHLPEYPGITLTTNSMETL